MTLALAQVALICLQLHPCRCAGCRVSRHEHECLWSEAAAKLAVQQSVVDLNDWRRVELVTEGASCFVSFSQSQNLTKHTRERERERGGGGREFTATGQKPYNAFLVIESCSVRLSLSFFFSPFYTLLKLFLYCQCFFQSDRSRKKENYGCNLLEDLIAAVAFCALFDHGWGEGITAPISIQKSPSDMYTPMPDYKPPS